MKINKAIQILKKGGIVVYPTDTAYAIGCKFKDKKAIARIMKLKKRKDDKFTIIASSLAQVKKYFKLKACQIKIAKKYWPGPVSIVVSPKYSARVPNNKIARQLARGVGMPIIATSLNVSGQPAVYFLKNGKILNRVDCVINIGKLKNKKPSTIAQCVNKKIKIIRHGPIRIKIPSK